MMKISKTQQNQREKLAFVYKCRKIEKKFEKGLAKWAAVWYYT